MKCAPASFATAFAIRVLPGPGRAVEQDPLRRSDRESVEQLGVLQRQLDHLPHPAELLLQSADILVGDAGCRDLGLADRLLLDRDEGRRRDLDEALRLGRHDHERKRAPHQEHARDHEHVPAHERAAGQRLRDEALQPRSQVHPGRARIDRGDRDGVGVGAVDPLDRDAIPDADAGVPSDDRLDPNEALSLVVGLGSADERRRRLSAPNLDHVAEPDLEPLSRLHVEASRAEPDVLLERLGDAEGDGLAHRRADSLAPRLNRCASASRNASPGNAPRPDRARTNGTEIWKGPRRTVRAAVDSARPGPPAPPDRCGVSGPSARGCLRGGPSPGPAGGGPRGGDSLSGGARRVVSLGFGPPHDSV